MNLKTWVAAGLAAAAVLGGGSTVALAAPITPPTESEVGPVIGKIKAITENDDSKWAAAYTAGARAVRFDFAADGSYVEPSTCWTNQTCESDLTQNAIDETKRKIKAAYDAGLIPVVVFQFTTRVPDTFMATAIAIHHYHLYPVDANGKGGLRYIEIGNEWNIACNFWDPSYKPLHNCSGDPDLPVNPDLASQIITKTAFWLKAYRPYTKVITGGLAPGDYVPNDNNASNIAFRKKEIAMHEFFGRMQNLYTAIPIGGGMSLLRRPSLVVDAFGAHPYTTSKTSGDVSPNPTSTTPNVPTYNAGIARGWRWMADAGTLEGGYKSMNEKAASAPTDGFVTPDYVRPIWITEYASYSTRGPNTELTQGAVGKDALDLADGYSWTGPFFWFATQDKDCTPTPTDDCGAGLYRENGTAKTTDASGARIYSVFNSHPYS